jgi:succinyl-CoA synthetase beta subunit
MARVLEHDALRLLSAEGLKATAFDVVSDPEAAIASTQRFDGSSIVKALIPCGGRGKAGGIRIARSPDEAASAARALLGTELLHFPVERVFVGELIEIARELFVSITFDSASRRPLLLCSLLGGVDVGELLEREPDALIQRTLDPSLGLPDFLAREVAEELGLSGNEASAMVAALGAMYRAFVRYEAITVEINPLCFTPAGELLAPTALMVIDDLALFRQPALNGVADPDLTNGWRPLTKLERKMREIDRRYPGCPIRFNEFTDGDVALMVMGGGAGFFTLDAFMRLGGKPATTFDITPGAFEEKLREATAAIVARPGTRALIAGGNMSNFLPVDVRVRPIVRGLQDANIDPQRFPVVFRFDGPCIEEAKAIAAELPGIEFFDSTTTLENAVKRIVERTPARP